MSRPADVATCWQVRTNKKTSQAQKERSNKDTFIRLEMRCSIVGDGKGGNRILRVVRTVFCREQCVGSDLHPNGYQVYGSPPRPGVPLGMELARQLAGALGSPR